MSGFVMQLASLCGLVLGAFFAGKLSGYIAPKLIELTGGAAHLIGPLSYLIAFALIIIVMLLLGKAVQSLVKAMELNLLNRLAGALFCSLKYLLLFSIVLNLIIEIDQGEVIIKKDVRENTYTYTYIQQIAPFAIPYLKFDWVNLPDLP